MKQQDEQVFECGDRETAIQTIDFVPIKPYKRQASKQSKKSDQIVAWKFNALSNQHQKSKFMSYKYTKNISFQDEERYANQQNQNEDNDEYQESCFCQYYKNCEENYRKKNAFGTSWIGRKQYFASTFIDPSKIEKNNIPYFSAKTPFFNDQSLATRQITFDSDFESGNLLCAFKVSEFQYDLLLQNDLNTKGNTQWFYFRIRNAPKNRSIKINIVNLRKPDSLFNYGLLPCVYSFEEEKRTKKGWYRGGKNVRYFKNGHPVQNSRRYYFTLSFTISTVYQKDFLCVAHSYPYTTRDLNTYLQSIQKIKYKSELFQRQTLVNTVGKNKVEVLTIQQNNKVKGKPIIFIMARQHPGETPSSFVCQGIIDYLLSKDKQSQYLRKNYQIKIIPMVNPDGVAAGNYRTNLSGVDLNRRWDGGIKSRNMHQSVYIKKYLSQIAKSNEVAFILDIHGHSRKFYSFFYGNPNHNNPIQPRIYPLLCSKLGPSLIRFQDSTFSSQQFKRNTARIQLGLSYKISNIFTYQVSFFGYIGKDKQKKHFHIDGLRELGQILGKAIYIHQRGKEIFDKNPDNKEINLYKKCIDEFKSNKKMISIGERENSGSQSSPSECQLKENDQQRLQSNEEYLNNKSPSKVKIVKKLMKTQSPVISKSSRQMQVLDLAQVNSAFPNNIIALIPSSYINKLKKPILTNAFVQTEDAPIIKIYQSCKKQDQSIFFPQSYLQQSTLQSTISYQKRSSQLVRSSILNRPKTTIFDIPSSQYTPLRMPSQRKSRQLSRREERSSTKKSSSTLKSNRTQDKSTQTTLTFGKSIHNTSSNLKIRQQQESHILESKIDPSFTTLQYKKSNLQLKFPSKALSKSIYQHIKYRRINGT